MCPKSVFRNELGLYKPLQQVPQRSVNQRVPGGCAGLLRVQVVLTRLVRFS